MINRFLLKCKCSKENSMFSICLLLNWQNTGQDMKIDIILHTSSILLHKLYINQLTNNLNILSCKSHIPTQMMLCQDIFHLNSSKCTSRLHNNTNQNISQHMHDLQGKGSYHNTGYMCSKMNKADSFNGKVGR